MITLLILFWLITLRLEIGAKCIVTAWLIASAFYLRWREEREQAKRLRKLLERSTN